MPLYPTGALAQEHVALMGGYIDEQEVRSALHPDATDPIKQQERAAEQDAARKHILLTKVLSTMSPWLRKEYCEGVDKRRSSLWPINFVSLTLGQGLQASFDLRPVSL